MRLSQGGSAFETPASLKNRLPFLPSLSEAALMAPLVISDLRESCSDATEAFFPSGQPAPSWSVCTDVKHSTTLLKTRNRVPHGSEGWESKIKVPIGQCPIPRWLWMCLPASPEEEGSWILTCAMGSREPAPSRPFHGVSILMTKRLPETRLPTRLHQEFGFQHQNLRGHVQARADFTIHDPSFP